MGELPTAAAERLVLLLASFGRVLTVATEAVATEPEFVSNTALLVLCDLDLNGTRRPGELMGVTSLSSGGMSKLLDRMEAARIIKRSYGKVPGDHRGVLVSITARGRRTVRTVATEIAARRPEARSLVREMTDLLDG